MNFFRTVYNVSFQRQSHYKVSLENDVHKSPELTLSKAVRFSEPEVTGMWVKPRITKKQKATLFYSRQELENFLTEYKNNSQKVKRVHFSRPLVTDIAYVEMRSKAEAAMCFYSNEEINNFVQDFVDSDNTIEEKSHLKKIRGVQFSKPLVTDIAYVEKRSEAEVNMCFYSNKEINKFLHDFVNYQEATDTDNVNEESNGSESPDHGTIVPNEMNPVIYLATAKRAQCSSNLLHETLVMKENKFPSVCFAEPAVDKVEILPCRTEEEYSSCIYGAEELEIFLKDFIDSFENGDFVDIPMEMDSDQLSCHDINNMEEYIVTEKAEEKKEIDQNEYYERLQMQVGPCPCNDENKCKEEMIVKKETQKYSRFPDNCYKIEKSRAEVA